MRIRSLMVAALLILGVGCDDPEVQEKVASILEHGGTQAYANCYTPSPVYVCGGTTVTMSVAFRATLFQDDSSFLEQRTSLSATVGYQFTPSGYNPQFVPFNFTGSVEGKVQIDSGDLVVNHFCSSPVNAQYDSHIDIGTQMTCTGFNLEAFGITP